MSDPTKNYAKEIGGSILDELKKQFDAASITLSQADRELLARISDDAAALHLEAAIVPQGPARDAIGAELKIVDASLDNLASVAASTARGVFWGAVKSVIG